MEFTLLLVVDKDDESGVLSTHFDARNRQLDAMVSHERTVPTTSLR